MSRLCEAIMNAKAAADEWEATLIWTFGHHANARSHDQDVSAHPKECRAARAKFFGAMVEQDNAWQEVRAHCVEAPLVLQ